MNSSGFTTNKSPPISDSSNSPTSDDSAENHKVVTSMSLLRNVLYRLIICFRALCCYPLNAIIVPSMILHKRRESIVGCQNMKYYKDPKLSLRFPNSNAEGVKEPSKRIHKLFRSMTRIQHGDEVSELISDLFAKNDELTNAEDQGEKLCRNILYTKAGISVNKLNQEPNILKKNLITKYMTFPTKSVGLQTNFESPITSDTEIMTSITTAKKLRRSTKNMHLKRMVSKRNSKRRAKVKYVTDANTAIPSKNNVKISTDITISCKTVIEDFEPMHELASIKSKRSVMIFWRRDNNKLKRMIPLVATDDVFVSNAIVVNYYRTSLLKKRLYVDYKESKWKNTSRASDICNCFSDTYTIETKN